MSKSRKKATETGKVEQAGNEPNAVSYIRCAVRLLAIVKAIYRACGVAMPVSPEMNEIPDLPEWAANICEQLHRTIFKRLLELKPESNRVDWRNLGRLLGVWQRQFTFLNSAWKDVASAPPNQDYTPTAPPESFVMIPPNELLNCVRQSILDSIISGLAQSPVEQNEFFAGLHEGSELLLDSNDHFAGDRGRTKVYFELLSRWLEIEEIRKSSPGATRRDLYNLIAGELGDKSGERWPWFNDVCDEIGLRTTEAGRPSKSRLK